MANPEHLATLKRGVEAWNEWRTRCPDERPDLSGARLFGANLFRANLAEANLWRAILDDAKLRMADLFRANLFRAKLRQADLSGANLADAFLSGADLSKADLSGANLAEADLSKADLEEARFVQAQLPNARLERASCVGTNFDGANLTGCNVYGLSAWKLSLTGTTQIDIVITPTDEAEVTVDNLEVAQFIYLLLNNQRVRDVINTITSKVVLILGRFTPERKVVLDALRAALRTKGYSPVVFDFEKPAARTLTETVRTLASLARFVIADITDAKSIPHELAAIVPDFPSVVVQPLLLASQDEYGMFESFRPYPWVLPVFRYDSEDHLLANLEAQVVQPAVDKVATLRPLL